MKKQKKKKEQRKLIKLEDTNSNLEFRKSLTRYRERERKKKWIEEEDTFLKRMRRE